MATDELTDERLIHSAIGAFYYVYNTLGYGFLEVVYATAFEKELSSRGLRVAREVSVPIFFKGEQIVGQRLDMIVNETLVVEIKSTPTLHNSATRQLYNYLRASRLRTGLLLHFGPTARFWRVRYRVTGVHVSNASHVEHACPRAVNDPPL